MGMFGGYLGSPGVTPGGVAGGDIASGAIQSGHVASGSVQGFFGTTWHIASGTVGVWDFGSGAVIAGAIGSGAVQSGNIGSGQIGSEHIADGTVIQVDIGSGAVGSGALSSGVVSRFHLASGAVNSGHVGSGAIQGFFGATRHIASGTVGVSDLGSGGVLSGNIASGNVWGLVGALPHIASGSFTGFELGSGSIVSGRVASGQLADFHLASGAKIDASEWSLDDNQVTTEPISGATPMAVGFNQSGYLQAAMAGVSGRMPAVGVVVSNYLSGATAVVHRFGRHYSTIYNFSGWTNRPVYVGRSGQLSASGAPTSSGDVQQIMGVSITASGLMLQPGDALEEAVAGSGDIGSGAVTGRAAGGVFNIASGSVDTFDLSSGIVARAASFVTPFHSGTAWSLLTEEIISGVRAVCISQSGTLRIAMASVSGRMPAIGVVIDGVLSGLPANVFSQGFLQFSSGMADYSGHLGKTAWVGRSGHVVQWSGSFNSGGLSVASGGDFLQRIGAIINSGAVVANVVMDMSQTQLLGVTAAYDVIDREFGL